MDIMLKNVTLEGVAVTREALEAARTFDEEEKTRPTGDPVFYRMGYQGRSWSVHRTRSGRIVVRLMLLEEKRG